MRRPYEPERKNFLELNEALHALDALVDEPVPIRAIGGYALAYHGIRPDEALTADIDTATPTYSKAVRDAMRVVAKQFGLEPDWINNDVVFTMTDEVTWDDVAYHDELIEACYEPCDLGFEHIDLRIADVETLATSKGYACEVSAVIRGDKDLRDLLAIAEHEGCATFDELTRRFPTLKPMSLRRVREIMDRR